MTALIRKPQAWFVTALLVYACVPGHPAVGDHGLPIGLPAALLLTIGIAAAAFWWIADGRR